MIKIRLMGKKEDVHEMIKRIYQIKGIEVMELSDFYTRACLKNKICTKCIFL